MPHRRIEHLLPTTFGGAVGLAFTFCFLSAMAMNLAVAPLVGPRGEFGGPRHDGYWELGTNLIRGNGFVLEPGGAAVFHRPPLVPVLFAPLTLLPGPMQQPATILLHSLLMGLTCGLTFDLTRRAFGLRSARCALVLVLGYPWLYWHVRNPMNVVAQTTCAAIVLYLLGRELLAARRNADPPDRPFSPALSILLGLAAAAAILTHGTMLLSVPLLLAAAAAIGIRLGSLRTVRVSVAAGLIALLAVAPWTYRNWCVTGRFVPVVGGAGLQYYFGHVHWGFDGRDDRRGHWPRIVAASVGETMDVIHYAGLTDPELDARANQRMLQDLRAHPDRFGKRVALNAAEFYLPVVHDVLMPKTATWPGSAVRALQSLWHLALVALACAGLWKTRRDALAPAGWIAFGAIVALAGCYCPFVTSISQCQYCLPTLPILAFAGAAVFAASGRETDNIIAESHVRRKARREQCTDRSETVSASSSW